MSTVRRGIGAAIGAVFIVVLAIVLVRAIFVSSKQVSTRPAPVMDFDSAALATRLSQAIQFKTVSEGNDDSVAEQTRLAAWLLTTYPNVHRVLTRETIGAGSLLYTWKGTQPDLPALLFLGHMDVVAVDPSTESKWSHPPFSGAVDQDSVWGRGSLDDKASVIAILEAAESLIALGFRPQQTVLFAFGHDEESGGEQGAKVIAGLLQSRSIKIDALLDEGGVIANGIVPGVSAPVALVGIAEKGYVNIELRSDGGAKDSGHSSMPPPMTHVGRVARAVDRIQSNPFPADLRGATQHMFEVLAPEMNPAFRTLAANLWLFEPVIEWQAHNSLSLNAALRTTIAPTVISGGVKENVIPSAAHAVVNLRILPGDSVQGVLAHVRASVDDPQVDIQLSGAAAEPSNISDPQARQFLQLAETIRSVFPQAVVAPYLVVAATDARHYVQLTPNSYRFLPLHFNREDLQRIHGVDERVSIRDHMDSIRFYRNLIERWADAMEPSL